MITSLFDILNCEKLSNVQYFCVVEELHQVLTQLKDLKISGIDHFLMRVYDLYDSLLIMVASTKVTLKYQSPKNLNLYAEVINETLTAFPTLTKEVAEITSDELERSAGASHSLVDQQQGLKKL